MLQRYDFFSTSVQTTFYFVNSDYIYLQKPINLLWKLAHINVASFNTKNGIIYAP